MKVSGRLLHLAMVVSLVGGPVACDAGPPAGDAWVDAAGDSGADGDADADVDADVDVDVDADADGGDRPVVMLTGYWSPTGLMIAQFSRDPELNPDGWAGENWEGRGYDVVGFLPDPAAGYSGDFEVDYQATSEDFWRYTEELHPIAIMSFGAGAGPWEIEWNARNLSRWVPDESPPTLPTPSPPDGTVPSEHVRHSTLPVEEIAERVNSLALPGIGADGAWVDWDGDPGAYLCEFMAYHVMWYQAENGPDAGGGCLMAGFTHVASGVPVDAAAEATEEALRALIDALDAARGD